ncbi:MAG: XDD3 family exosortase-dependent surface protein [Cyanobacteria bacterium J06632_22]
MFKTFSTVAGVLLFSCGGVQVAQAGTFYNGWNYSIDAFDDGSGGSAYEIKGLAVKETTDSVLFSLTGGAALTGVPADGPTDGNIGWADMMLNFSGDDYNTAADNGDLFGIRFAATNDSGVDQVGLYKVDSAIAVYADNNGYDSLKSYYDAGFGRPNTMGDIATEQAAFDYFGETSSIRSNIGSGTYLGGITFLTDEEAAAAGLDFANFDAVSPETHTFKVDRDLLPSANFLISVFLECINDGIALRSNRTAVNRSAVNRADVPEPSAVGGLALVGLLVFKGLRRR